MRILDVEGGSEDVVPIRGTTAASEACSSALAAYAASHESDCSSLPNTDIPRSCAFCLKGGGSINKVGIFKCSSCRAAYYCSRLCQRLDWPDHKKVCAQDPLKEVTSTPAPSSPSVCTSGLGTPWSLGVSKPDHNPWARVASQIWDEPGVEDGVASDLLDNVIPEKSFRLHDEVKVANNVVPTHRFKVIGRGGRGGLRKAPKLTRTGRPSGKSSTPTVFPTATPTTDIAPKPPAKPTATVTDILTATHTTKAKHATKVPTSGGGSAWTRTPPTAPSHLISVKSFDTQQMLVGVLLWLFGQPVMVPFGTFGKFGFALCPPVLHWLLPWAECARRRATTG